MPDAASSPPTRVTLLAFACVALALLALWIAGVFARDRTPTGLRGEEGEARTRAPAALAARDGTERTIVVDSGSPAGNPSAGAQTDTPRSAVEGVTLRILRHDGEPVPAGFEVGIHPAAGPLDERRVRIAAAVEDGTVHFDAVEPGRWRILPGRHEFEVDASSGGRPETVRLDGYFNVRGRVLEHPGGQPIAGAEVALRYLRARSLMERIVATTDAEGRYAFESPGPAALYLRASIPGRIPSAQEYVRSPWLSEDSGIPDFQPLDLRLGGVGASIVGRCVDDDGRPLQGVRVWVLGSLGGLPPPTGELTVAMGASVPPVEAGPTAADGTFVCNDVPAGEAKVVAVPAGRRAPTVETVEVPSGPASVQVQLHLLSGTTVRGTVRDARGRPVPDARLTFSQGGVRMLSEAATTDAQGRFVFERVSAGRHQVSIRAATYPATREFLTASGRGEQTWDLVLPDGIAVSSRIETHEGQPAPDVLVAWIAGPTVDETRTDARGRFSFQGRTPDPFHLLVRIGDGRSFYLAEGDHPRELAATLTLPAPAAAPATFVGRVLDDEGEPVDGAIVLVYDLVNPRPGGSVGTGPEGRFRIEGVEPGRWSVMARLDNRPTAHRVGFDALPGGTVDVGDLVMPQPVPCSFELLLPTGIETSRAWSASVVDEDAVPRVSRVQGTSVVTPPLSAGRYTIEVTASGIPAVSLPFVLTEGTPQTVRIPIETGRTHELRIRCADGSKPPSWVFVSTFDAAGNRLSRTTRVTSRFAGEGRKVGFREQATRVTIRAVDGSVGAELDLPRAPGGQILDIVLKPD